MTIVVRTMAAQTHREYQRLMQNNTQLAASARAASAASNSAFGGAANGLTKWGSQVQWAGRQLTYNFTLPLAVAGGAATKFALENEAAFVRVEKVYGDAAHGADVMGKEVQALEENFRALSDHFGVHQAEVIKVAGDWAAAGSSGVALAKSTKLTLETMILGELDAAKATTSLIAIQAQYGMTIDELTTSIDTLNMVENETGASMGGLIDSMARAAGVARSAGIDVLHLAALTSALVPAAGTAAQAGNGLKTMVSRLLAPTGEAAEVMGLMGMNIEDLGWQSLNGVQRLELMAESFKNIDDAQKAYVSSAVASRWQINKFDVLMGDIISETGYYQRSLNAAGNETENLKQRTEELAAVMESNPHRIKTMWVILQNAMADIIQPVIPVIVYLAQTLANLAKRFADLDPAIQKAVLAGLALLALIGIVGRYVGATAVLFGLLRSSADELGRGLGFVFGGFKALIALPFKTLFSALGGVAKAFKGVAGGIAVFGGSTLATSKAAFGSMSRDAANAAWALDAAAGRMRIANKVTGDGFVITSMQANASSGILKRAGAVFGGIADFIRSKMSQTSATATTVGTALATVLPASMETGAAGTAAAATGLVTVVGTALMRIVPEAGAAGAAAGGAFSSGLAGTAPRAAIAGSFIGEAVITSIVRMGPDFSRAGRIAGGFVAHALITSTATITAQRLYGAMYAAIQSGLSRIPQLGAGWGAATGTAIAGGISTALTVQQPTMTAVGVASARTIYIGAVSMTPLGYGTGATLGRYLALGVGSAAPLAITAGTQVGTAATGGMAFGLAAGRAKVMRILAAIGAGLMGMTAAIGRSLGVVAGLFTTAAGKLTRTSQVAGDGFVIMSMKAQTSAGGVSSASAIFGRASDFIKTKFAQATGAAAAFASGTATSVGTGMEVAVAAMGAGAAGMNAAFSAGTATIPGQALVVGTAAGNAVGSGLMTTVAANGRRTIHLGNVMAQSVGLTIPAFTAQGSAAGNAFGTAFAIGAATSVQRTLFGAMYAAVLASTAAIPQIGAAVGTSTALTLASSFAATGGPAGQAVGRFMGTSINIGAISMTPVVAGTGLVVGSAFAGGVTSTAPLALTAGATVGGATGGGLAAGLAAARPRIMAALALVGRSLFAGLFVLFANIARLVATSVMAIATFLTTPWGIALAAVVALFIIFRKDLADLWDRLVVEFRSNGEGIAKAFQPVVKFFQAGVKAIGDAFNRLPAAVQAPIIAVINFIKAAAMKIYEWFSYLNPFARHSPSLVESVQNGMYAVSQSYKSVGNVGAVFSKAARDLAAYKNLASSLKVDEWTAERDAVSELMPQGLPLFQALVGDLGDLNRLLDQQATKVARQEAVVEQWQDKLASANNALDVQQRALDKIDSQLASVQAAYDSHEAAMQSFAETGITGQRAMSDAIFENQMAQQRLRLEIMKLEDAGGSIDNIKSRMSQLQGEIEKLRGMQGDLRAAGAGSDVLGPVSAQIDAMEAQYKALASGTNAAPIQKLQTELEALGRQGERLDLENSINFDPLTRQIDQLSTGMKELPFEEIIAGVGRERAAMDALLPSISALTAAQAAQAAVVDQYKVVRDAIELSYNTERDALQGLQDEYQLTADAISEVEEALRMVSGQADAIRNASDAASGARDRMSPAAEGFLAAAGGDFEDVGGNAQIGREQMPGQELWDDQSKFIEDMTLELSTATAEAMGAFDMFGPIKEKWNEFKGWWGTNVQPGLNQMGGGFKLIGTSIGDAFEGSDLQTKLDGAWTGIKQFGSDTGTFFTSFGQGWKDGINPPEGLAAEFSEKMKQVGGPIAEFGHSLGKLFGPQVAEIFTRIRDALGPTFEKIRDELEKWGPTFDRIGAFFVMLWNSVLKPFGAWLGIVLIGMLSGLFTQIGNIIGPIITFIGDVISTVLQFIRGFIDFIIAVLTGDLGGMLDGIATMLGAVWSLIVSTFQGAWDLLYGIVAGMFEAIIDVIVWFVDLVVGHSIIPDFVDEVVLWFQNMWDWVVEKVSGLVNGVIQWFKDLWNGIVEKVAGMVTAVIDRWNRFRMELFQLFVYIATNVLQKWEEIKEGIKDKVQGAVDGAKARFEAIRTTLANIAEGVKNEVTNRFDTLKTNMLGAFEWVRDRVGGVFSTMTGFIKTGINGALSAVNSLIRGLNKVADVLPGLDWQISTIPLLAKGGAIPGQRVGAGFTTNGARAIVGEGNPSHPEYVIPTDPLYRDRAAKLYKQLGARLGLHGDSPELGVGGPIDVIKGVIGSGASLAAKGMDWIKDAAAGAVSTVLRPFKDTVGGMIAGISWKYGRDAARSGLDQAWEWATNADEAFRKASNETGGNGPWRKPTMNYATSSGFGMRVNPVTGVYRLHAGTDMAAPMGTPIFAAAQGLAQMFGGGTGLGNYVKMDHGGGLTTVYGHMSSFVGSPGAKQAGEQIGRVGSTGNSTGPHLHFEVRRGGTPMDPNIWMRSMGVPLAKGGIIPASLGGTLTRIGEAGRDEAVIPLPTGWQRAMNRLNNPETLRPTHHTENNTYNFYGDLSFPNVKNGDDAEDFLRNLGDMGGR